MKTDEMRFACQTYSWQMSMERFRGRFEHMCAVAAAAGFTGMEPETIMLGRDWNSETLYSPLRDHDLSLAALCLVNPWRGPRESDEERALSDRAIEAAALSDEPLINLVMYPGSDRADLRERQRNGLACMKEVAQRAADAGVECSFHPNSPAGSVFRTQEDYDFLFDNLDPLIGFTPDVGHLLVGGMDPVEVISAQIEKVRHVHIKDVAADGTWAETGAGVADIEGVLAVLRTHGFKGWVAFEDESPLAEHDPDAAVSRSGDYLRKLIDGAGK